MSLINKRIADSIRRYPTLYRCRTDVLEHWFCVIGNGMEWQDGQLVSIFDEPPLRTVEQLVAENTKWMRERLEEDDNEMDASTLARYRVMIQQESTRIRFTVENASDIALVEWSHNTPTRLRDSFSAKSIYPLCAYSRMSQVPDDVDPEWLAAVREMIFVVFRSEPSQYGFDPETNAKQHETNIQFASQTLASLARRFGDGGRPASYESWCSRQRAFNIKVKAMIQDILTGE